MSQQAAHEGVSLDERLADGRPSRWGLRFDLLLFVAVFGWLPCYALWTQYDGLLADRRTAAEIARSGDGHLHAPPFRLPKGCGKQDFSPFETIGYDCQASTNFLGYGWTWTPPWSPAPAVGASPLRGRTGNAGYYRMGDDVVSIRCSASLCAVVDVYRDIFRPS